MNVQHKKVFWIISTLLLIKKLHRVAKIKRVAIVTIGPTQ